MDSSSNVQDLTVKIPEGSPSNKKQKRANTPIRTTPRALAAIAAKTGTPKGAAILKRLQMYNTQI